MQTRDLRDRSKLEWLQNAAHDAFNSIDRGEGIGFESMDELEAYICKIGEEVSAELSAAVSAKFPLRRYSSLK